MSQLPRQKSYYRGEASTQGTSRHLHNLLPSFLQEITKRFQDRPEAIMAAWTNLVGPRVAPMTEALSFREGILTVKVKNSTLYSLLAHQEKARLVQKLKDQFPYLGVKSIVFRMG